MSDTSASGLRTARSQNVLVCWWGEDTRADEVRRAQTELRALGREHASVAMLSLLSQQTRFGNVAEGVRREAEQLMAMPDVPLVASAVVFEGDGFGASILRSILSGLSLVAKKGRPMRVFADLPAAEAWLHTSLGPHAVHRAGELARDVKHAERSR